MSKAQHLHKMKVLLAATDKAVAQQLTGLLEQWGHEVKQPAAGAAVLDVLQQGHAVDVLILGDDILVQTRLDICRRAKALAGVYILLLSSPVDIAATSDGLLNGADDYITHPVDSTELWLRLAVAQRVLKCTQTRVEAAAAALETSKKFEVMLDRLGVYVYSKDLHGCYTYVNEQMCELFNRPKNEILGQQGSVFFCLQQAPDVINSDRQVIEQAKTIDVEEGFILSETGESRYYVSTKKPLFNESGDVIGLLGVSTDITRFKEAEELITSSQQEISRQAAKLEEDRELYELVFKNTRDATLLLDTETFCFIDCNQQALDVLACTSKTELINKTPQYFSPKFQADGSRSENVADEMCALALINGSHVFEWQHLSKADELLWAEISLTSVVLKGRAILYVVCKDIQQRKAAEAKQALSARVFNEVQEAIVITNLDKKIIDINPAFCALMGYEYDEALGLGGRTLHSAAQSAEFFNEIWRYVAANTYWRGEIMVKTKAGELKACLLSISSVLNDEGQVINYLGTYVDISQSKEQQEKLKLLAHYDPLTGLPNRELFADRFQQAIAHSKRNEAPLAICFVDLDSFKAVNDSFGHGVGDSLLMEVARRITASVREGDTVSRQGGDEFVLLLANVESVEQCERVINRMLVSLAKPYVIDGRWHQITASCGIALFPDDADALAGLIKRADQAMYHSKRHGKNRLSFYNNDKGVLVSKDLRA